MQNLNQNLICRNSYDFFRYRNYNFLFVYNNAHMESNHLEQKIKNFWEKDVWKANTKHIHNVKIKEAIEQVQKLSHNLKPNKKFFLSSDGEFKIKSDDKINGLVEKIKLENINYIKTHADAIPEYHFLIIEHKKSLLFLHP